MREPKKILFILPYPLGNAPSQRFRVEAFFPILLQNGYQFTTRTFFDEAAWKVLYKKGSLAKKAAAVAKGFFNRWVVLFTDVWRYDYVFIHREASPVGMPFFEWIVTKLLRKKMIYDFDDAIWIPNTTSENKLVGWIKAFWKVKYICRWAYKIAAGNDFLCAYARQYNQNVFKIPTCVDTVNRHNTIQTYTKERITVGWTGSHSTLPYLDDIIPVIRQLQEEIDFELLVISNRAPEFHLKKWTFLPWQEKTEIDDLLKIDIGIMPLKKDDWSEGKCGFKLIQYLSLGIPAVASPVGVNSQIVEQGKTGYLCAAEEEWATALRNLLTNPQLRGRMGRVGRQTIVENFSIQSQQEKFLQLFT